MTDPFPFSDTVVQKQKARVDVNVGLKACVGGSCCVPRIPMKSTDSKSKPRQAGLHQTKRLFPSAQQSKQPAEGRDNIWNGGNICKLSDKGLLSKIYEELIEINRKTIYLKYGQRM